MLDKILDFIPTKETANLTLNSTYIRAGSGIYRVRRNGLTAEVLLVNVEFTKAVATNTTIDQIAIIPSGYRPSQNVYSVGFNPNAGLIGYLWFLANGTVGMRTLQAITVGRTLYSMGPFYLIG